MKNAIERGMELAARRPEVMPGQAGDRIHPVYEDIQRTLRVPFVNLIFRTLANDPDYLVPAWERLAPVLRTRAFERAADELRSQALLEPVPEAKVEWEAIGPLEKIRAFNDTIHYVLPKLLLIATAWDEESWGGEGEGERVEIALGVAEGTDKAPMLGSEGISERVRRLLEREKSAHGHPLTSSYYRVLANWPEFLEAAWTRVEPRVGSPGYRERRAALAQTATRMVHILPMAGDIRDLGRTREISDLLSAFRREFIPSMMLDVTLIKAMVDGEASARQSPFSALT